MSVVLHVCTAQDCDSATLRCATAVKTSLIQHAIEVAILVEHNSGADPRDFLPFQSLKKELGALFCVVQPSQVYCALKSILSQLGCPRQSSLLISFGSCRSNFLAAAAALECQYVHILSADPYSASIDVLQQFARLMQQCTGCLVCGYVMKRSRQLSLCAEGMLPLLPRDGMCFMPLDSTQSLHSQQPFDILLQKPTDYLEVEKNCGKFPQFTANLLQLNAYVRQQLAHVCVVEPLNLMEAVMDRAALGTMLDGVCLQACRLGVQLQCPKWLLLSDTGAATQQQLEEINILPPIIFKPQVACGVAESHQMSFLLHWNGLEGLDVPFPAIAQEYVDHGGVLWKVYVAGKKVFLVQRKSTPDLQAMTQELILNAASTLPYSLNFDSLKSLPTSLPWIQQVQKRLPCDVSPSKPVTRELPQRTAELVASILQEQLQLTLFGFDLVISNAGEVTIIDVNFFPSYKGHAEAPRALREALLEKRKQHVAAQAGLQ